MSRFWSVLSYKSTLSLSYSFIHNQVINNTKYLTSLLEKTMGNIIRPTNKTLIMIFFIIFEFLIPPFFNKQLQLMLTDWQCFSVKSTMEHCMHLYKIHSLLLAIIIPHYKNLIVLFHCCVCYIRHFYATNRTKQCFLLSVNENLKI